MSGSDLNKALSLILENLGEADLVGPRAPELLDQIEALLGGRFPRLYRDFLEQYGAGNIRSFEVFGVVDDNLEKGCVPNGAWLTNIERQSGVLPMNLFIIGDTGDGDYYCLDMLSTDESAVYVFHFNGEHGQFSCERVFADFGAYLLAGVKQAVGLG